MAFWGQTKAGQQIVYTFNFTVKALTPQGWSLSIQGIHNYSESTGQITSTSQICAVAGTLKLELFLFNF